MSDEDKKRTTECWCIKLIFEVPIADEWDAGTITNTVLAWVDGCPEFEDIPLKAFKVCKSALEFD